MTTICATCKRVKLHGEWRDDSIYIAGPKTDSICPRCAEVYRAKLKAMKGKSR